MTESGEKKSAETPNHVHGRLLEAVHISGYTFERAFSELEWLLEDGRWQKIGAGYDDINAFLATIDFSEFRIAIEQRKKFAGRLKQIQASQRATAKMLGVGAGTIARDLSPAPNGASAESLAAESGASGNETAPIGAPAWFQGDADPSKLARKQVKQAENRKARIANIAEISKGNRELDTAVRYPIIYADPPWRYENPPIGASDRSIENHYPTMTLDEICRAPVLELAAADALLYLWATAPKLAECFAVIEAWGFEYRTNLVWDKEIIGMGYHARNQHEILLIAKRGEIPPPPAGKQPSSVHRERRGKHSAKPVHYYEMIEAAYPELTKIELFARAPRKGWAVWGNESEGVLLDISNA